MGYFKRQVIDELERERLLSEVVWHQRAKRLWSVLERSLYDNNELKHAALSWFAEKPYPKDKDKANANL